MRKNTSTSFVLLNEEYKESRRAGGSMGIPLKLDNQRHI